MSRSMVNRIKLAMVAALVAVCCFWVGLVSFAKAEPAFVSVDELQTFAVTDASLIVEGEDGINGLEFKATMSASEYEGMMGAGFKSVETGLVIMPGYYALPQAGGMPAFADEDTMFGKDAIYDWAEYDEVAGEYVYNGTKTQIININANEWVNEGDVYAYYGAIVDVQDHNEEVCFVANAYVKTTDVADVVNYKFTSEYGASIAFELESEYAGMNDDQKAWVDANWTRFETVEEDLLVYDVTGQDSVMLAQIIATNVSKETNIKVGMLQPEVYVAIDNNGNEIDLYNSLGGTIDLTDANNIRMYTVMGKIGDTVLFTMPIDLRSKTAPFLWNDEISMNSVDAIDFRGDDKVRTDYYSLNKGNPTEETIDGKDYVSFTASGDNGTWFSWKPLHDKSYYEGFAGKGVEISASMIVDASNMGTSDTMCVNQAAFFGESVGNSYKTTETLTYSATLDKILSSWDKLVDCEWEKTWGTRFAAGMVYVYNVHNGGKIYVGDFKVDVDVSANAIKAGDILVNVDEVNDLTALDLTQYINKDHLAVIDEYAPFGLTYEMKGYSIADEIEVADLTKVDVSNAKRAAYILSVKSGASVLYTATIDLYNTTDKVVWAESLTEYNVVSKYSTFSGSGASGNYYTENVTSKGSVPFEVVDSFTGDKTYSGSFAKFVITEAMVLSIDIKPLHTKAYYNETIGDSSKVLNLRGWSTGSGDTTAQLLCGQVNYGIGNAYVVKGRQGFGCNKLESFVFSLDNYLLATSAEDTYHGKYYDYWETIEGDNVGSCRPLISLEVKTTLATAEGGWVFYFGIYGEHIVDAGESLATKTQVEGKVVDLSSASSYDLINLLPESQRAKYKAMAALWIGKNLSRYGTKVLTGSAVGFQLKINGTTHCVIPDAEGKTMLNLDDYVVAADGTVSTTTTVRSLLAEGNNSATIVGYAPTVPSGVGYTHAVTMVPTSTITIVGPAVVE